MFNYYNLNDVEFENLCKDVMERMLCSKLRIFAKGTDGGIDLTDNTINHNIIVQVKHYIRSKFSDLRTTLRKEVSKVEKWNPNKYYLCCGMELTDANIREIYNMFSSYMESDENIITLIEIDEFLQKPENSDIVRKHYKLWLYSSGILNQLLNQNIFVDCEALLSDIEEECKYFVQTEIYNKCLDCLDKHRIIMLTGGPGVGKTITSKMLVLYYASQNYTVRYTTNGDISDIKRALSSNNDLKEIVLLDDCLGQHYFNMKETQESELTYLIKYIKMHENKKLILNSRITILNEAKQRYEQFNLFFKEKKINEITINLDSISALEKAKIFYNHLIFKNLPKEYYSNIREDKNYLKIIMHPSYTPRIIEHVTLCSNYLKISPDKYADYILRNLDNPNDIWKNEYYHRIKEEDRAFLTTLYSLTDTIIEYSVLKKCFEKRLSQINNIDYTLNNFEMVLARLNQSIIKIVDYKSKMHVGVINPSVNDFLKQIFISNNLEVNEIRRAIVNFLQLKRCYSEVELPQIIEKMVRDGTIYNIDFNNQNEKDYFIVANICINLVLNKVYKATIKSYLCNSYGCAIINQKLLSHQDILKKLLEEPCYSYYDIKNILDEQCIENMLEGMELGDLTSTINVLWEQYFVKEDFEKQSWFIRLCKKILSDEISRYIDDLQVSDYCDNYDIQALINQNSSYYEYGVCLDKKSVVSTIKSWIRDDVYEEISEKISVLNENIYTNIKIPTIHVNESDIEKFIDSYMEPDPDDYYEPSGNSGDSFIGEIEAIFDR